MYASITKNCKSNGGNGGIVGDGFGEDDLACRARYYSKPEWHLRAGEEDSVGPLPPRSRGSLGSVSPHVLDGQPRLSAGVEVDLVRSLGERSLPEVAADVEGDHDGSSEVRHCGKISPDQTT